MTNIFLDKDDFERIFKAHLKTETYSKSIESLFSPRMSNRIDYQPYYQRNYVWDKHKASFFIESILLGTEIPPLIFFNNGQKIEVIDGRQRFETIKRFMADDFSLSNKGLASLKQLSKNTFSDLGKDSSRILDIFLDAKIRIIEFEIVNEPRLDLDLEDKVKKEVFGRYNSGITPLKKSEIDNAVYDKEPISNCFKQYFKDNQEHIDLIYNIFHKRKASGQVTVEHILQFVRKHLVLHLFPINHYARGNSRTEILSKLFDYFSDHNDNVNEILKSFLFKLSIINKLLKISDAKKYQLNRWVYDCVLWMFFVLENESFDLNAVNNDLFLEDVAVFMDKNIEKFSEIDSHYYSEIMNRFIATRTYFENKLNLKLGMYVSGTDTTTKLIKKVKKEKDQSPIEAKLNELETLRVTKPDPSRESIDDVVRKMNRRKFLVRPSYQRSEVINIPKASKIIESILLGIILPAIFIFKREDGISEVIDGQQRLLTILGYYGEGYIDIDNNTVLTKNNKFALKGLNILKDLNGKKFNDLEQDLQDKILDFELFIVEIEQRLNPEFNPVDLFIRLNDKPYPIKENSFEMWNSWVERDVIVTIKANVEKHINWFYLKKLDINKDRDRMLNEELYTTLTYFEYKNNINNKIEYIDMYQKAGRINARIKEKKDITTILTSVSQDTNAKTHFIASIKQTESFIKKLKLILLDRNIEDKDELNNYFLKELDSIFRAGSKRRYVVRTMQDFYIVWYILYGINLEMIKYYRIQIKKEIKSIFNYMKNIPEKDYENNVGFTTFMKQIDEFKDNYKMEKRRLRLSDAEKNEMIIDQKNRCPLSGSPIFVGDDVEVDHIEPISLGGLDVKANVQMTHKEENRKKGSSIK